MNPYEPDSGPFWIAIGLSFSLGMALLAIVAHWRMLT